MSALTSSQRRGATVRRKASAASEKPIEPTPQRLDRAQEGGQSVALENRRVRIEDPFDVMRATRALAPHDRRLNDLRWLTGEALRRLHQRAALDTLRAVVTERVGSHARGPRSGLPLSEAALHARDKIRAAEALVGAASWPVLRRIVIEGARLCDCRPMIVEVSTPWRADAILADRLRCALDALGAHLGVTASTGRPSQNC
jgi:hypothetical protein